MNRSERILEAWRSGKEPNKKDLLIEMSQGIKEICDNINNHLRVVKVHLILCFIFGDNEKYKENLDHWVSEIAAAVTEVPYVKGKNKFPTYKQLKQRCLNTWSDSYDVKINGFVNIACSQEHITDIPEYNGQSLVYCTIKYYEWLLQNLSDKGYVDNTEVKNEIEKLMDEYRLSL